MSFQEKLISQPHNSPYSSSPNGENTNTKEYLPSAKECDGNLTSVTSFNPLHTQGATIIIPILWMTELRPKEFHNLLTIKQIVHGKVITQDCQIPTQMAKSNSIITLLEVIDNPAPLSLNTQPSFPTAARA